MKECKSCKGLFELTSFSKDKRQKDGYFYYCKNCCKEKDKRRYQSDPSKFTEEAKAYYEQNKKRVRERNLQRVYGLTIDQHNKMREEQLFSCLICKKHENETKRGLYVDHCHTTGKVRGLLCQECNFMLGLVNDDVQVLEEAIKYLQTSKETHARRI